MSWSDLLIVTVTVGHRLFHIGILFQSEWLGRYCRLRQKGPYEDFVMAEEDYVR